MPTPTYTLSGATGGNGRLVEWQGWSFFATLRPSTGLAALDISFKGKSVAYELSLAEAAAHYSGTGSDQVFYLDSACERRWPRPEFVAMWRLRCTLRRRLMDGTDGDYLVETSDSETSVTI